MAPDGRSDAFVRLDPSPDTPAVITCAGETILRALDAAAEMSVLIFDVDTRYQLVRGGALRDNAVDPQDLEGRRAADCLPPARWAFYAPLYERALRGESSASEVVSPDGRREYLIRIQPVRGPGGEIIGGVQTAADITELRRAQRDVEQSNRRFQVAMDSAPIGMAIVTLDRVFVEVNESLCRMLRRRANDLIGQNLSAVVHRDDEARDLAIRAEVLSGSRDWASTEKRLIAADGGEVWVQHSVAVVRDNHGEPQHYVSQFSDITDAVQARAELERVAHTDQLTGLPNRLGLHLRVADWFGPGADSRCAVLYLDLDDFKTINDSYGHALGDRVLSAVAARFRHVLREVDVIARIGGDEFLVVLQQADRARIVAVADHLHGSLREPLSVDGRTLPTAVSIGAILVEPGESLDRAMRRADAALYRAKGGRGSQTSITIP